MMSPAEYGSRVFHEPVMTSPPEVAVSMTLSEPVMYSPVAFTMTLYDPTTVLLPPEVPMSWLKLPVMLVPLTVTTLEPPRM